MPLLAFGHPSRIPKTFDHDTGHYRSSSCRSMQVQWGGWQIGWTNLISDYFEGNRDATRLYLSVIREPSDPLPNGTPMAFMDRSDVHHWQVAYRTPLRHRLVAAVGVTAHWLVVSRLQKGAISGVSVGTTFDGDLLLRTTRGLPNSRICGRGYAVDFDAVLTPSERLVIAVCLENLFSGIWIRELQRIQSAVSVDKVIPDVNGFLHAEPVLSGQVSPESYCGKLPRHFALVARYTTEPVPALLIVRKDPEWRVAVGAEGPIRSKYRWWAVLWVKKARQWQLGASGGQWDLTLGWEGLAPTSARSAVLGLRWTLPLQDNASRRRKASRSGE